MDEPEIKKEPSDEERLKQIAEQIRRTEYNGLSEKEINERESQKEMLRKTNIEILNDTLSILKNGYYEKGGKNIKLNYSQEQMSEAHVFMPDDIELLRTENSFPTANSKKQTPDSCCTVSCKNADTLNLAQDKYQYLKNNGTNPSEILILNMASATNPGGQARKGSSAQEENLCRRSSLLLSLESDTAKQYYDYNNVRKTRMGSDSIIISPYVEVIKNSAAETLDEPFHISVMSCAAPMVRLGLEGMSQHEYEEMLCKRIQGMLLVAASQKYRHLILGAFGCGVYGNDAATVSDLFDRAIHEFNYCGMGCSHVFASIDFAVLCTPDKDYNYREFRRNFPST